MWQQKTPPAWQPAESIFGSAAPAMRNGDMAFHNMIGTP